MKKYSLALLLLSASLITFFSCKKINEATTLGGDLIPPVDNVNTFDTTISIDSRTFWFDDTTKLTYSDQVALGAMNDPEFGRTEANVYFSLSSSVYSTYPFIVNRQDANDSIRIDSIVLQLAYTGNYGDTQSMQTVRVREISQTSGFSDTALFQINGENQPNFQTTGSVLGSKTFFIQDLNDSQYFRRGTDSAKRVNVLRIPFDAAQAEIFGKRLANYDTAFNSNGGFRNDSILKTLFKGLAIETNQAVGNGGLAYFSLGSSNTKLTVYFTATKNGKLETALLDFNHVTNGQANIVHRTPSGPYLANLNSGASDLIYMQSGPGSYAELKIPALSTLSNRVIHRAEVIATITNMPSVFAPPSRLIIDRIRRDTAFTLHNDLTAGFDGSLTFDIFGGDLKSDATYRFNITRHVQGIITRHEPNDTLRLYAPLRTLLFATPLNTRISVPVLNRIADGRAVLAGGNYSNASQKLRLRIIYSKL